MQLSKSSQVLLLGLITTISQPIFAQNDFSTTKKIDVSQLITKQTLQCKTGEANENYLTFYNSFGEIKKDFPNLNGKPYSLSGYTITGINAINANRTVDASGTTISRSMDVNVNKFGVTVLRISSVGFKSNDVGESGGYYLVLKGTPSVNMAKLKKANISISKDSLQLTPAKNTRIKCTLIG